MGRFIAIRGNVFGQRLKRLIRRQIALLFLIVAFIVPFLSATAVLARDGAAAPGANLPRWRGFNLLEMFQRARPEPFHEEDFRLISRMGFNFVRLPLDYRCWIRNGDWEQIDDEQFRDIDQAIAYGEKYHVHVCLCFHRAPGYTVAQPREKADLWTDADAQRVCAMHWAHFARRYKGIPSSRLSFNLLNEPKNPDRKAFVRVIGKLVAAIRAEDPDRLIISDGLEWGEQPVLELAGLHVMQSTRGYRPMEVSHYKAGWVHDVEFSEPAWPAWQPIAATLKAPHKESAAPEAMIIDGPFPADTNLRVRVHLVSSSADLVVAADGKAILSKSFKCGPGEGEWKTAKWVEKYGLWQNIYDRDYAAMIPAGTKQARVYLEKGDWLDLSQLALHPAGVSAEDLIPCRPAFNDSPARVKYSPADPKGPFIGPGRWDRQWLHDQVMDPWLAANKNGIDVIVGEWGAFNLTPHDVMLRWAEDSLANWKAAGWGWALWNFRGPFGVLDSGRADVKYEPFEGHQLDRQLLELLQKY